MSLSSASGQAYQLFDNRSADQSRLTLPFEVEWPDTYAVGAGIVKAANFGIVAFAIDGRPLGTAIDGYSAATARPDAIPLGTLELAKGKHTVTMTVTGKNSPSRSRRRIRRADGAAVSGGPIQLTSSSACPASRSRP